MAFYHGNRWEETIVISMPIKLVISDNDGCFGDFKKFSRPHEEDLRPHIGGLYRIRDLCSEHKLFLSMNTGRSLEKSIKTIHGIGANAPCALEMGTLIYDPNTDNAHSLAENRFIYLKDAQNAIRKFMDVVDRSYDEIKERLGCNLERLDDRKHIITYEFENGVGGIMFTILHEKMPDNMKEFLKKGYIKVVQSKGAIDIMPDIGKGAVTDYIMELIGISPEKAMSIGDAAHTDIEMLKKTGYAGCPSNSDDETKAYVRSRNGKGYISMRKYEKGVFDIISHGIRNW